MPTTGVIDSNILTVSVDGSIVACQQQATITINVGNREVICKDASEFKSALAGQKDWSCSLNGLLAFDHTYGGMDLAALAISSDPTATIRWGSAVSGDKYIEGEGLLTSVTLEAGNKGDNATYSAEFMGDGAPTIGTVA